MSEDGSATDLPVRNQMDSVARGKVMLGGENKSAHMKEVTVCPDQGREGGNRVFYLLNSAFPPEPGGES